MTTTLVPRRILRPPEGEPRLPWRRSQAGNLYLVRPDDTTIVITQNGRGRYSVCWDGEWWRPSFDTERWAAHLVEYAVFLDTLADVADTELAEGELEAVS